MKNTILKHKNLIFNLQTGAVKFQGNTVFFRHGSEMFRILEALIQQNQMTYEELFAIKFEKTNIEKGLTKYREAIPKQFEAEKRKLKYVMRNIRAKLGDNGLILNFHKRGYILS